MNKTLNYLLHWPKVFVNWYKSLYVQRPWYMKAIAGFGSFIVLIVVFLIMVDFNFLFLFGKSPTLHSIHNPNQATASEIYSADGKLLGKYFRENRTPVSINDISPLLITTLIDTEDERFYQHFGVDLQGLLSAAKDMASGDARGASTITQQLVKNMFKVRSQYSTGLLGTIPPLRIAIMKAKEWIGAIKIELFYSKQEILEMYLNTVDFGSNAYGIKTACKTYFNTTPDQLTYEQAAVLVGLLKATTTYNPRLNPENSLRRRNVVLDNLVRRKDLSKAACDSIKQIPIRLSYNSEKNYDGQALYFRQAVADFLQPWCKENNIDLYGDGLKIYTTLDSRMQQYAEAAAIKQMRVIQRNFDEHWGNEVPWRDSQGQVIPNFIEDLAKRTTAYKVYSEKYGNNADSIYFYLNKPHKLKVFDYDLGTRDTTLSTMDSIRYMERYMHCGFLAMEPQNGHVKAWVGDISFNSWKYDKVTSKRQPGSTFKLFVYTAAMNSGLSPCDYRIDEQQTYKVGDAKGKITYWSPHNANGFSTGDTVSLKAAFAQSINTIAAALGQEIGIHTIAETAHAMGIKSKLDETPALSLGTSDVSLLELVNSYSTVINEGKFHEPVLVTKIVDSEGKTIYEAPIEERQVIPYSSAFLMTEMLKGGITIPGGTSQALWGYNVLNLGAEFGGKTGTSSNHSDAWYVGVTPKLVAGGWVGGEHRSIHFRTGQLGQGSRTALPIFAYFMEKVLKDPHFKQYVCKFPKAKTPIDKSYDCQPIRYRLDTDSIALDSLFLEDEPRLEIID